MEKLTINRIGEEKVINYINKKTGLPDSFKKAGIQTNEYGDRWFDVTFRGDVPVRVGQTYEFEVASREYNGKTYYDARLPNKTQQTDTRMTELENKITSLTLVVNRLVLALQDKGVIETPKSKVEGTNVDYPESNGPTAFDDILPEDLPY